MPQDPDSILEQCWAMLADGAARRKSPMHAPVIATIDEAGSPSQRVMVLREAIRDNRTLRFHTDSRATKVSEIGKQSQMSVLAYDPDAAIQLRLSGTGSVELQSDTTDEAWNAATLFARRCYLAEAAPGSKADAPTSGLPKWIEGKMPTDDQVVNARPNFAILLIEITAIEWLHLANDGHRRIRFDFDHQRWQSSWLVP